MKRLVINYWRKSKRSKMWVVLGGLALLLLAFFLRDEYHPILLLMRQYIFLELLFVGGLFAVIQLFKQGDKPWKRVVTLLVAGLVLLGCYFAAPFYQYCQDYYMFRQLEKEQLVQLPLTQQERIQPQNNITTMAYEVVAETQEVSEPHLVKIDSVNQWTMAIQPAQERQYFYQRMQDEIEEIFSVSSTAPFPKFSGENRHQVTFSIGESLVFSRNTYNACVNRFNLWQLFSLEPDQVYYLQNDEDEWVQVVSLVRWKGFFFPYPTFGGVMVIPSGQHTFVDWLERMTIGKGTYLSREEVKEHDYLHGQNIMSERVTRRYAKAFKFLGGFWDPMPYRRKTAVKIPDLAQDQRQQPFVTDFDFSDSTSMTTTGTVPASGLYHYFGLEPLGEKRTGLSISVFMPGDGESKVYYYHHGDKKEGLAGVSAMPTKVKESRMEYDWDANAPVEFRPYIRDFAGKRRLFWLSTIVTLRQKADQFDGSATPKIVVTDALYKDPVWLDSSKPSTWERTIQQKMEEVWTDY